MANPRARPYEWECDQASPRPTAKDWPRRGSAERFFQNFLGKSFQRQASSHSASPDVLPIIDHAQPNNRWHSLTIPAATTSIQAIQACMSDFPLPKPPPPARVAGAINMASNWGALIPMKVPPKNCPFPRFTSAASAWSGPLLANIDTGAAAQSEGDFEEQEASPEVADLWLPASLGPTPQACDRSASTTPTFTPTSTDGSAAGSADTTPRGQGGMPKAAPANLPEPRPTPQLYRDGRQWSALEWSVLADVV